jgi:hypothetical protein
MRYLRAKPCWGILKAPLNLLLVTATKYVFLKAIKFL